eukprot:GEMP01005562.1.p1 GENE.GEMP01005562.1~~GEMP01005562.1.p1  ORF type:complete len:1105 (+),score=189.55 GEMP01005562.1:176-3490(+)
MDGTEERGPQPALPSAPTWQSRGESANTEEKGRKRSAKGRNRPGGNTAADRSDNWRISSPHEGNNPDEGDHEGRRLSTAPAGSDNHESRTWDTGQERQKWKKGTGKSRDRERSKNDGTDPSAKGKKWKGDSLLTTEYHDGAGKGMNNAVDNHQKGKGGKRDRWRKGKGKDASAASDAFDDNDIAEGYQKGKRDKCRGKDAEEWDGDNNVRSEDNRKGGKGKRDRQRTGKGAASVNDEDKAGDSKGGKIKGGKTGKGRPPRGKKDTAAEESNKSDDSDSLVGDVGDRTLLSRRMSAQLRRQKYECMICFSAIRRSGAIWSCESCWASFHLHCIHSWIKKSNENVVRASAANVQQYHWPCPGCRHIHVEESLPEYRCFCGQEKDPLPSPHYTTHSCGRVCERIRPNCPHPCTTLCHAGPCNACSAYGGAGQCYCGIEVKAQTRCGEPKMWSCGNLCGAPLSCKNHNCPLKCHAGPCAPCAIAIEKTCHCGNVLRTLPCGEDCFICNEPCSRLLSCGVHTCQRTCHPGECGECPWTPALWGSKCACGATPSLKERKSCNDPLEVCSNQCGNAASCGHKCQRSCHEDACGACVVPLKQDCRCKYSRRTEACHVVGSGPYICDTACKQKKSCNRHRCTSICCEARSAGKRHEIHMCLQVCGRPLPCGEHTCEEFCHLGNCVPCRVIRRFPLTCGCGAQVLDPPIHCGTPAPFCMNTCDKEMSCGHRCPALCHVDEHPPCIHLVTRSCAGRHTEMKNIPCHVETISCSKPCDRILECGHRCVAACHSGDVPCPPCTQPCRAARVHCEHQCGAPCHPGTPCDEAPCQAKVHVTCLCGLQVKTKACMACPATGPRSTANLKCLPATCGGAGKNSAPASASRPGGWLSSRSYTTQYAKPLVVEWRQHRKYLLTVEGMFEEVLATERSKMLPACVNQRKNLVCTLALAHYGLDTSVAHQAEDYWVVTISPSARMRWPEPKLSLVLDDDSHGVQFPSSSPAVTFKDFPPKFEYRVQQWIYANIPMNQPFHLTLSPSNPVFFTALFCKATDASQAFQRITGQGTQFENVSPVRSSLTQWIDKLRVSLINVPFLSLRSKASAQAEKDKKQELIEDAW